MRSQQPTKTPAWPLWVNLILPGVGLIALGRVGSGLVFGALFALAANLAIFATLIVPDEFSRAMQGLWIGIAAGSYAGIQIRAAATQRELASASRNAFRRGALQAATEALAHNDPSRALACLRPIQDQVAQDLLLAVRRAQALTALQCDEEAREAWKVVRSLDRHHLYRAEIAQNEAVIASRRSEISTGPP